MWHIPAAITSPFSNNLLLIPRPFVQKVQVQEGKGIFIKLMEINYVPTLAHMGHHREIQWLVHSTKWSLSLWSRPWQLNKRIQMAEPELSFNPLGPFWTKLPPREYINQAGLGLPLEEERSIMLRNGQNRVPSFQNWSLIIWLLSWSLPRK